MNHEANEIYVRVKQVYGKRVIYPVCSKAMLFASISGHTTLTDATVERIRLLGYNVKVEQQVLEAL